MARARPAAVVSVVAALVAGAVSAQEYSGLELWVLELKTTPARRLVTGLNGLSPREVFRSRSDEPSLVVRVVPELPGTGLRHAQALGDGPLARSASPERGATGSRHRAARDSKAS